MSNFKIFGDVQVSAVDQMRKLLSYGNINGAALMADHHLGYSQPIGGVVAYSGQVSPSGVGFDIGCGNKAVKTNLTYGDIKGSIPSLADEIFSNIEFGVGRNNTKPVWHNVFNSDKWDTLKEFAGKSIGASLFDKAQNQLGTVGSGNHYVDVFVESTLDADGNDVIDDNSAVWVGVHFGSRGLGHNIASGFLKLGMGLGWDEKPQKGECYEKEEPTLLDLDSDIGRGYWDLMNLAGEYAYAGRDYVTDTVVALMGADIEYSVHNHHNFAWLEEIDGVTSVVVRKGSTPLWPNQESFIGGSMCDTSVIVRGIESQTSKDSFYSTVHGAGRIMSRMQAKGKVRRKTGEVIREGLVTPEMLSKSVADYGIQLRGGGLDESPFVYRKLQGVLDAHADSTEVIHRLKQVIVCMAGADTFDPWKD